MNDIDLTPRLVASMATRPRVRGRYSASELFFIFYGMGDKRTTPEKWLNAVQRQPEEMLKMWDGNMIHHAVQELLSRNYKEAKREYQCGFGFTVVGKADYLPGAKDGVPDEDEVWEFKSSDKLMKEAKPWHEHQTRMYCSMFGKRLGRIFQPVRSKNGIYLKETGVVTRDDKWFMEEMKKLNEFHKEVELLWQSKGLTMAPLTFDEKAKA